VIEFVNSAIEKYCISLATKHGIKDIARVRSIVERTLIANESEEFSQYMGLDSDTERSKILRSSLQILKYLPPIYIDFLKRFPPEFIKFWLNNKSIIKVLVGLFKFSPSLEEALNFLPSNVALDLFENEDLVSLSQRENFIHEINKGNLYLYTLDELCNVLDRFTSKLQSESDFIIKTGFPLYTFRSHKFLDEFSRCYYTRCPERIEFVLDPFLSDFPPEAAIYFSKAEFCDLIDEVQDILGSKRDYILEYKWQNNCYEEAPIIEGLSKEDAEILEKARPIVFEYKLKILEFLLNSIKQKNAFNLWENCFNIFLDSFKEIYQFFLQMDMFYDSQKKKQLEALLNIKGIEFLHRRIGKPYKSGGVTSLFFLIGYIENEFKFGTNSKTKAILNEIPKGISLISYYQFVNQPWGEYVNSAYSTFLELYKKQEETDVEFVERLESDSGKFCKMKVNLPVESRYFDSVSHFYNMIRSLFSTGLTDTYMVLSSMLSLPKFEKKGKPIRPFPSPSGIKWSDITIRFLSEESVRIIARDVKEVRNYAEMGFMDDRTKSYNLLWMALLEFGKNGGEISWKTMGLRPEIQKNLKLKSHTKRLRKHLKQFFGIEDDPFMPYRREKAYKTKFRVELLDKTIVD
jgi:hypothetical protein